METGAFLMVVIESPEIELPKALNRMLIPGIQNCPTKPDT